MSNKLKTFTEEIPMGFKTDDRVLIVRDLVCVEGTAGLEATVVNHVHDNYLVRFDTAIPNTSGSYEREWYAQADMLVLLPDYSVMFAEERFDAVTEGYHEPISEYRACMDEDGFWVVEATRVKTICKASDEAEARRIADALNITK